MDSTVVMMSFIRSSCVHNCRIPGDQNYSSLSTKVAGRTEEMPSNRATNCAITCFKRHKMPPSDGQPRRVLCIACSSKTLSSLDGALRYSQLRILTAATRDKGVAICVAGNIAVAVLDAESIRGEAGSVAKSLKDVRPNLPIVMLEERRRVTEIPVSVDAVVPVGDPERLLKIIRDLLEAEGAESVSAAG